MGRGKERKEVTRLTEQLFRHSGGIHSPAGICTRNTKNTVINVPYTGSLSYFLLLPPVSRQVFGTGAQSPGHPTRVLIRLGPIIMRGEMLSNIRPDYSH